MGILLSRLAWGLTAGLLICLICIPVRITAQGQRPEIIKGTAKGKEQAAPPKTPGEKKEESAAGLVSNPQYQQALKYYQRGKYDKAIKALEQARQKHPSSPELYYRLGLVQAARGDLDQAKASFQEALRLKSGYGAARLALGELYSREGVSLLQQGNYKEAEGPLREAINLNPQDDAAYNNLGVALAHQERWTEALEALKGAVDLNPNNAQAQFNLGVAYYLRGDKDGASQQYAITSLLDPEAGEELFRLIQGTSQVKGPFRF